MGPAQATKYRDPERHDAIFRISDLQSIVGKADKLTRANGRGRGYFEFPEAAAQ
jgi:hypothetical protein